MFTLDRACISRHMFWRCRRVCGWGSRTRQGANDPPSGWTVMQNHKGMPPRLTPCCFPLVTAAASVLPA